MDECQHCGNKQNEKLNIPRLALETDSRLCEMLKSFKAFKDNKAELSGEDFRFFLRLVYEIQ